MNAKAALASTMQQLLQKGKGILAADESVGTLGKRFDAIGLENTSNNRRDYRLLLANTANLEQYINGVILFEETFADTNAEGMSIPSIFAQKGIVPGIKVDKGLVTLANTNEEKITKGLDDLEERLDTFKVLGAKFAKWRNVYSISNVLPSLLAIKANASMLARYAASCQAAGIVPIVEPEVLMDGDHSIHRCGEVSTAVLHAVFEALYVHQVDLQNMLLKPSMVTCGKSTKPFSSPSEVADHTLSVFKAHVPAAVPSINFLSGGQTPEEATANLNAINACGIQPWVLSFSYGRALQESCIATWKGNPNHYEQAQEALLKRARLNSMACFGEYKAEME